MEVQEYLEQRLKTCSQYTLTDSDKKLLDSRGIEEYIFKKLTSKKFRKWSMPPVVQGGVRKVIQYCVSQQKRIRLDFSFGGFKLWRMPTAPEVDWSEFFSLFYVCEYVAPIIAVYTPGIFIDFSSADIAVTAVNNVPRADVDRYFASFKELLKTFQPYIPKNLHIDMTRLRDLFKDEKDFLHQVEPHFDAFRKELADNPAYKEELRRGAIQNVQLEGGVENLSKLSEEEMQKRRTYSYEAAEGMYAIQRIQEKAGPDSIWLLATKLAFDQPSVMIGTTRRTTAKFWAGMGVLTHDGDSFVEYVISPKQWEAVKNQPHETLASDLIPLKNFKEILLYPEKFNFSIT